MHCKRYKKYSIDNVGVSSDFRMEKSKGLCTIPIIPFLFFPMIIFLNLLSLSAHYICLKSKNNINITPRLHFIFTLVSPDRYVHFLWITTKSDRNGNLGQSRLVDSTLYSPFITINTCMHFRQLLYNRVICLRKLLE